MVVLDTLTACWSGDEDSNTALTAFDRDVMKRLLNEVRASVLVLDHTGNPQQFVRRRGVHSPRGAASKGQKTDFLLDFHEGGDRRFQIEHFKERGGVQREPAQTFEAIDGEDEDGRYIDIVPVAAADDEKVAELADQLVELIVAAEAMTTKMVRAAAANLKYGTDVTSKALKLLESEKPRRVYWASERFPTERGGIRNRRSARGGQRALRRSGERAMTFGVYWSTGGVLGGYWYTQQPLASGCTAQRGCIYAPLVVPPRWLPVGAPPEALWGVLVVTERLPGLLDAKALQDELGVKRGAAEKIMTVLPIVTLPGLRKVYVRREDVQRHLDEHTLTPEQRGVRAN